VLKQFDGTRQNKREKKQKQETETETGTETETETEKLQLHRNRNGNRNRKRFLTARCVLMLCHPVVECSAGGCEIDPEGGGGPGGVSSCVAAFMMWMRPGMYLLRGGGIFARKSSHKSRAVHVICRCTFFGSI
jgi:hypothetical protein